MAVAVLGATGYTGAELVRLLASHPAVSVRHVTSARYAGLGLADVHPALAGAGDLRLESFDADGIAADTRWVFSALPHGSAAPAVAALRARGCRVIDLSADFRFRDPRTYALAYGPHPHPELLAEAVYGLTEFHREAIRAANLVANPGCYPVGALLGLVPLLRASLLEGPVFIDAKSGASGAGREARTESLFCEVDENVRAYQVGVHRHAPEMVQVLQEVAGSAPELLFAPHLVPVGRGILTAIYARLRGGVRGDDVGGAFAAAYGECEGGFVVICPAGRLPEPRHVRGTNLCHIGWACVGRQLAVFTAIDNLGKGAGGQAVQNFNVMAGLPEQAGLGATAATVP